MDEYYRRFPERPSVLALTGTDLYRDLARRPAARRSVQLATHLVALNHEAGKALPAEARRKLQIILQSAEPLGKKPRRSTDWLDVVVAGHLRSEKDPLRCAMAVRNLPVESRIRVTHIGRALTNRFRLLAEQEMRRNARYRWLGELPRAEARRWIARSHILAMTSRSEGGASVIAEAIVDGTLVVGTDIPGIRGMIGADYPALFPAGDTSALRSLLVRLETDARFRDRVAKRCQQLAPRFSPQREKQDWIRLLDDIAP